MTELRDSPIPGPGRLPGPALPGILAAATMLRVAAFTDAGGFSPLKSAVRRTRQVPRSCHERSSTARRYVG